jgi:hypothetical protein
LLQVRKLEQAKQLVKRKDKELARLRRGRGYLAELAKINSRALANRPFLDGSYEFRPISPRDRSLRKLRRKYPYFGYVDVEIEGVQPFVMFSNDDDEVAQIYF